MNDDMSTFMLSKLNGTCTGDYHLKIREDKWEEAVSKLVEKRNENGPFYNATVSTEDKEISLYFKGVRPMDHSGLICSLISEDAEVILTASYEDHFLFRYHANIRSGRTYGSYNCYLMNKIYYCPNSPMNSFNAIKTIAQNVTNRGELDRTASIIELIGLLNNFVAESIMDE